MNIFPQCAMELLKECLNPPIEEKVESAIEKLVNLDAIQVKTEQKSDIWYHDDNNELIQRTIKSYAVTPLGKIMNSMGVEPEIAKIFILGLCFGLKNDITVR